MVTHRWRACVSAAWRRKAPPSAPILGTTSAGAGTRWLIAAAFVAISHTAAAHGIVGNRLFPGTLAIDDPAVADELALPSVSSFKRPDDGSDDVDNRINWAFARLLTSTVSIGLDSGWMHRNWGTAQRSGFDLTTLELKKLLYTSEPYEFMATAGLGWGIRGSGAQGVGRSKPDTIQPSIFFGKGLGDLPDALSWLRPFGITGAVTFEHPMAGTSTNLGIDPQTRLLGPTLTREVDTLHWGFSIQYSTYYLTSRFTPGKLPKQEPLHQLVPLIEFAFDSPRGEKTAATMNPGLAYVADSWQVAAEAIVPLNSEGGRTVGVRAQLLLFLDDLIPAVFGKPLLDAIQDSSPRPAARTRP